MNNPPRFQPGDRVVVKGPYITYNFAGTVIYQFGSLYWIEYDHDLPDRCLSFPRGCPQERWGRVHWDSLKALTTEKGIKPGIHVAGDPDGGAELEQLDLVDKEKP